ncbi:hypothetical protein ACTWQB_10155 [Piscibacillus sp. B03]|uniref:DUF3953 domain-containing protein n=1 Tax=Piscibacillus salipiscarius TaxID=299480 RepID=A0ABW5QES4_9BACI|nr:hypothetical protein [Piscibacillus salipiscarius]
MKNYSLISTTCLGLFIVLFSLMINNVSFGSFGKVVIISMCLLPLLGTIFGLKSKKGISKWLLIILNISALITMLYILVLGFGMGEV